VIKKSEKKKIFSEEVVSELVRKISAFILIKKDFGMKPGELFVEVAKRVCKEACGYSLGNTHFMNSLLKSNKDDMFCFRDPFVIIYVDESPTIYHRQKYAQYKKVIKYISSRQLK
jgi:hypothetical protein